MFFYLFNLLIYQMIQIDFRGAVVRAYTVTIGDIDDHIQQYCMNDT